MHGIIENQLKIHPPEATSIQVFAEPSRLSLCYNVGKMLFNDLELVPRVLLGILGGVCRLVLQTLTVFQTKKCHFP